MCTPTNDLSQCDLFCRGDSAGIVEEANQAGNARRGLLVTHCLKVCVCVHDLAVRALIYERAHHGQADDLLTAAAHSYCLWRPCKLSS